MSKRVWKTQNFINFMTEGNQKRVFPVEIRIHEVNLNWWNDDAVRLFEELCGLIKKQVIHPKLNDTIGHSSSIEKSEDRKRTNNDEMFIQGSNLQFSYRFRATKPCFSLLQLKFGSQISNTVNLRERSLESVPVSGDTLVVTVLQYDPANPYAPMPMNAATVNNPITAYFPLMSSEKNKHSSYYNEFVAENQEDRDLKIALQRSLEDSH